MNAFQIYYFLAPLFSVFYLKTTYTACSQLFRKLFIAPTASSAELYRNLGDFEKGHGAPVRVSWGGLNRAVICSCPFVLIQKNQKIKAACKLAINSFRSAK